MKPYIPRQQNTFRDFIAWIVEGLIEAADMAVMLVKFFFQMFLPALALAIVIVKLILGAQ